MEDLINYGFLPEFVGRFPVLAKLAALTREQMIHVMTTPRNALLKQYQALFAADGISLQLTHGAVNAIAEQADRSKTGARGLRSIVEQSLNESMYRLHTWREQVVRLHTHHAHTHMPHATPPPSLFAHRIPSHPTLLFSVCLCSQGVTHVIVTEETITGNKLPVLYPEPTELPPEAYCGGGGEGGGAEGGDRLGSLRAIVNRNVFFMNGVCVCSHGAVREPDVCAKRCVCVCEACVLAWRARWRCPPRLPPCV